MECGIIVCKPIDHYDILCCERIGNDGSLVCYICHDRAIADLATGEAETKREIKCPVEIKAKIDIITTQRKNRFLFVYDHRAMPTIKNSGKRSNADDVHRGIRAVRLLDMARSALRAQWRLNHMVVNNKSAQEATDALIAHEKTLEAEWKANNCEPIKLFI